MSGAERCLNDADLAALVEGDPRRDAMQRAQEHAAACDACLQLLACIGRVRALDNAAAADQPTLPDGEQGQEVSIAEALPRPAVGVGPRLGRYEIGRELGRGGMGVVYEARDPELDRPVAIKLLHRAGLEALARITREARAVAKLSHPNVVEIFDVQLAEQQAFIVMELVPGRTLRDWIREQQPSWRQVVRAFIDAGRGLCAAHALGLVHRDFKAANVIVDRRGRVKVLDFGLACADGLRSGKQDGDAPLPGIEATLTATGTAVGTPSHMAPEQHRGERVDHHADIYAFAVALYDGLYGTLPFRGGTIEHMFLAKKRAVIAQPPEAAVPEAIHRALQTGLAYEPQARWSSMAGFLEELQRHSRSTRRRGLGLALGLGLAGAAVAWVAAPAGSKGPQSPEQPHTHVDAQLEAAALDLVELAHAERRSGDGPRNVGHAFAAILVAASSGSATAQARAQHQLGDALLGIGEYGLAVEHLREGVALEQEVRNDLGAARAASSLVYGLGTLDRHDEALQAGVLARSLAERAGATHELLPSILGNEAEALPPHRNADKLARYELALALRLATPELATPRALALLLTGIGHSLIAADPARARACLQAALAINREALGESRRETLMTELTLVALDAGDGKFDACVANGERLYRRFPASETVGRASVAQVIAECSASIGDLEQGLRWATVMEELAVLLGSTDRSVQARALELQGFMHKEREDFTAAEALFQRALAIWDSDAARPSSDVAKCYGFLSEAARGQGELARAERYGRRCLEEFVALDEDGPDTLIARIVLADILVKRKQFDTVLPLLREARERPAGSTPVDPMLVAEAKGLYAQALWEVGPDKQAALTLMAEAVDALARRDDFVTSHAQMQEWLTAHSPLER